MINATSDNGSLCRHAGRWDTRDTCNDIMTVTGMMVTAHNIGNEFVDENFANRSDCTIRLLSFFLTLSPSALSIIVIIIRILNALLFLSMLRSKRNT